MRTAAIALYLASSAFAPMAPAEIYKWTDANGRTHFSDSPKTSPGAQTVDVKVTTYTPADNVLNSKNIILYATSWCGYCRQAREYFRSNGIPYVEYDIEKDSRGKRLYDQLGGNGVPLILYGDRRMSGFTPESFEQFYRQE